MQFPTICLFTAAITANMVNGLGCVFNSDCIGLSICKNNRCLPAIPAGGYCRTNDECEKKTGQACISGICMKAALSATTTLPQQGCIHHSQCAGQTMCVKNLCVPAITSGLHCTATYQCSPNEACIYGDCWKPLDAMSTVGCTSHSACAGSQLCQLGQCKAAFRTNVFCTDDSYCQPGGCKNFRCYHYSSNSPTHIQCISHGDCPNQKLCQNHKCIIGVPIGVDCGSSKQCPGSSICKHGTCFAANLSSVQCIVHDDCNGQQLCRNSKCRPAVPTGDVCGSLIHCPAGSYCKLSNCLKFI